MKTILLNNYDDYVALKNYYEENAVVENASSIRIDPKELKTPKFVSLHDSSNNKPLW